MSVQSMGILVLFGCRKAVNLKSPVSRLLGTRWYRATDTGGSRKGGIINYRGILPRSIRQSSFLKRELTLRRSHELD